MLVLLFDCKEIDLRNLGKLFRQPIRYKEIDLRNLGKLFRQPIRYNDSLRFRNGHPILIQEFPFPFFLKILSNIKGSPESLKTSLKKINLMTLSAGNLRTYVDAFVYLNTILLHRGRGNGHSGYLYSINGVDARFVIKEDDSKSLENLGGNLMKIDNSHLSWIICESIDFLVAEGYL